MIAKDQIRKELVIMIDDLPEDTMEQKQNKILAQDLWAQLKHLLFNNDANK